MTLLFAGEFCRGKPFSRFDSFVSFSLRPALLQRGCQRDSVDDISRWENDAVLCRICAILKTRRVADGWATDQDGIECFTAQRRSFSKQAHLDVFTLTERMLQCRGGGRMLDLEGLGHSRDHLL